MSMDVHEQGDGLIEYLAQRDIPCPSCKYNLRGLKENRCPECNQELVLSVQLVEPKMGPFIAVCVGLGTGVGFNLFVFSWFWYSLLSRGPWSGAWRDALPLPVSLSVLGALLWIVIKARSRFRRVATLGQWGCAVLAAFLSILSAVYFISGVT
jgi:hypothetical protein